MFEALKYHLVSLALPLAEHPHHDYLVFLVTLLPDLHSPQQFPQTHVLQRLLQHDLLLIDTLKPLNERLGEDTTLVPLRQDCRTFPMPLLHCVGF